MCSVKGNVDAAAKARAAGSVGVDKNASALTGLETVNREQIEQSMSRDIRVDKFTLSFQSKVLLRDADLRIGFGHKYGVIGPNGCGKSTLLRHISGRHLPLPSHIRILHVEQEVTGDETIALDAVLSADEERIRLLKEEAELKPISQENSDRALKASERLIEVYDRLKAISAYSAEARASAIMSGLGFTEEMKTMMTKQFSGGWRMRIALARALFVVPDLLILDEPTNHLDLNAVIWLEAYLRRWKKTLLVVSHDRDFLNYFVTDIMYVHSQTLEYFKGDYDTFERASEQTKRQQEKAFKKQQKALDKIQRDQTQKDRENKKKLEKAGLVKEVERDYSVRFEFEDPGQLKPPVVQVKDVGFGYSKDKILFDHVELNIDMESRIAVVGPNGVGKSTFMSLMLGELEPSTGEIIRNRHLRTVKFAQHFVDQLEVASSAVDYIQKLYPDMTPLDIRQVLGRFGLKGTTQTQSIESLSGGQKSRVMLVSIALKKPHMLFLDEPTNHLDIQSVDALSDALKGFPGGIILISHDQRLISNVVNEIWVVRKGGVDIYDGTFEDYRDDLISQMDDSLFISDDEEEKAPEKPAKKSGKK
jgi:ATPase subunit of ABC transporter with duplicated ATPase domains